MNWECKLHACYDGYDNGAIWTKVQYFSNDLLYVCYNKQLNKNRITGNIKKKNVYPVVCVLRSLSFIIDVACG